jgi:hypothetical protein
MKNQILLASLLCTTVAATASAGLQNGDTGEITLNGVLGRFGGGEFSWTGSGGANNVGNFISFCIEINETVAPGSEYNFEVNDEAVRGGVGGGNPDPLDSKTAALYTAFALGSLGNFSSTGSISFNSDTYSRQDQAAALQMAIWKLEEEIDSVDAVTAGRTTDQVLADKIEALALDYLSQATALDTGGIGNVRVLNLSPIVGTGYNQDMLILIPLPQAGALAAIGLAGLAVRRRR